MFRYGSFFNAVLSFVLVAAAIFFVVVKPYNMYMDGAAPGLEPEPPAAKTRRGRRARGDPRPHADAARRGQPPLARGGGRRDRQRRPHPRAAAGRAGDREAAVHGLDAVAQAREPGALPRVGAAPAVVGDLDRRRRPRPAHTRTDAPVPPAYFATLASASEATK